MTKSFYCIDCLCYCEIESTKNDLSYCPKCGSSMIEKIENNIYKEYEESKYSRYGIVQESL